MQEKARTELETSRTLAVCLCSSFFLGGVITTLLQDEMRAALLMPNRGVEKGEFMCIPPGYL